MKSRDLLFLRKVCLALCWGMGLYMGAAGQCLMGNPGSRSYDTVLNGIGYGTYALRFPQWNPDSGTLVSVKVSARVSVQYAFTLKNVDAAPSVYTLVVGREDRITGSAMATYDNITERSIGAYPLDPGGVMSQGPFAFLNDYVNTDSITTDIAPFLGADSVRLVYSPVTYTDLRTNNNSSYAYHASAQDGMVVAVTYLYCNSQVALATGLTRFTAALEDPLTVRLSWLAGQEAGGRRYEVQRSRDGQQFSTVATLGISGGGVSGANPTTVPAGANIGSGLPAGGSNYVYMDALPDRMGGDWYYRLAIDDPGHLSYSEVRVVTARATDQEIRVYPSPAVGFVNLEMGATAGVGAAAAGTGRGVVIGAGASQGWQVDLYTAGGSLVQRGRYPPASFIRVDFQRKMSPGTYFVRVMDFPGQHSYISSFTVTAGSD